MRAARAAEGGSLMKTTVVVWLLWFGGGNSQVTVSGIASEEACHELAAKMKRQMLLASYSCLSYSALQ